MLSTESGLITCGNRIILSKEMRPEMLQYVHKGHQGKERCLLRARNTVFWPKMTYDIQQLIERCIICQEHGKSQSIIGTTQELPPFPWHTLVTDMFYWKRMDFLIVADVFSKYFPVRKLPNSTSAAVCAELFMIVTELGLLHIIRSDCKGMEVVTPGSPSVVVYSENYKVLKCFLGWFISSFLWMVSQVPCPRCCPVLSVFYLSSDLNRVKGLW